jgi:two-component system sporulation sensor kinase A
MMNRFAMYFGFLIVLVYIGLNWYWYETPHLFWKSINILQSLAAIYASVTLLNAYRKIKSIYWFYYFLGVLCYMIAQLYWTFFLIIFGEEPSTFGFPEILWMIQYFFYFLALYNQNKAINKRPALRFMLDGLLLLTVSATVYWLYLIEPMLTNEVTNGEVLFNLFCSSANAVVLFGLLILYIYERVSIAKSTTLLLMIAFFMKSCGNTTALILNRNADWYEVLSWVPELCWFAGLMFLGFSALVSNKVTHSYRQTNSSSHYILRRYVPLIIVFMLSMTTFWSVYPLSVTFFGVIIAFVLLLLRLLLGIRDYESADKALQESLNNYRNLVENSLIGVFIEQDGRLVYVNSYCEKLFGYEPDEMIGKPMSEYLSIAEQQSLQEEFEKISIHGFTPRLSFECIKRDLSVLYVEIQAVATLYQGRKAISGTLLDITERKLSEQLLIRSEKLSVVGQLAAGVAHEIRNPLTALKGFTQLLYQNSDANHKYYEIMLTELERINYIVGEFMVLSKPFHLQRPSPHDLQEILSGIIPIIESQAIMYNISIQVEWGSNLPSVWCDANQIKQVFINLLKNSIEAMPNGGNINIRFESAA